MRLAVNCEICSAQSNIWAAIDDYDHYRCEQCGHLFVFPKPSQDELDTFYMGGDYYDKAEVEQERLLREAFQRLKRLQRLSVRFNLDKRLLDVGCASGHFIKKAIEEGWKATGVERSDVLAMRAREYASTEVLSGILEKINMGDEPYPIVTAWEVIEHTINPRAFFGAIAQNVAMGGLVALSTPLANGLPAKLLRRKYPMLIPPEHLSLFTRRSINLLAAEFGFEEISYRSFSNLRPTSLASGLAKLFIRKNITQVSRINRFLFTFAGFSLAWVPLVIDLAGWGTEMEIVFQRKK